MEVKFDIELHIWSQRSQFFANNSYYLDLANLNHSPFKSLQKKTFHGTIELIRQLVGPL